MSARGSFPAEHLAVLLREKLRHCNIEYLCNGSPKPTAMKRRVYDILHGKVQLVSPRVADEICIAANHPEWYQLL